MNIKTNLSAGAQAQASGAGENADAICRVAVLALNSAPDDERKSDSLLASRRPSKSQEAGSIPAGSTSDEKLRIRAALAVLTCACWPTPELISALRQANKQQEKQQ